VVASAGSALAEIVAPGCGALAADTGQAFADAAGALLDGERTAQRLAARGRAEQYPWSASVAGMLDVLAAPAQRLRAMPTQ